MSTPLRKPIEMTIEEREMANTLAPKGWIYDAPCGTLDHDEGYPGIYFHLKDLKPLLDYLTSINVDVYAD